MKESAGDTSEEDYPVNLFKFISSITSKTTITGLSITEPTPVHVAYSTLASMNHQWTINLHDGYAPVHVSYSTLASMNHQWTINLHDGYPPFYVLIPGESIPSSIPTLCNLTLTMFHFGVDFLHYTKETPHDLQSLPPCKGETVSSFSCPSLFGDKPKLLTKRLCVIGS